MIKCISEISKHTFQTANILLSQYRTNRLGWSAAYEKMGRAHVIKYIIIPTGPRPLNVLSIFSCLLRSRAFDLSPSGFRLHDLAIKVLGNLI